MSELENAPSCVLTRAKMSLEHAPETKPLVCIGLKVPITTRTTAPSRKKTESGFTWPNNMSGDSECRQKSYEVIKGVHDSKGFMPKAILFYTESING